MRTVSLSVRLRTAAMGVVLAGMAAGTATSTQGCSSKSDSGPPDTGHFAAALAGSFCSALHSCCDAAKIPYDDGSCTAQLQASFQSAIDVVKHGKVIYNSGAVAACQAAIHDREATCSTDGGPPPGADAGFVDRITAACWPVFKGTVALGQECNDSQECAAANVNVHGSCRNDTRPGADPTKKVCYSTTAHVLPGQSCRSQPTATGFETASCEPTLGYCNTSGATPDDPNAGTCTAYAKIDDDCISTGPGTQVFCDPQVSYCDYITSRKCKALPNAGDPCIQGQQCGKALYCDTSGGGQGVCAAGKPDGSDCKQGRECVSNYCQISQPPGPFDGGFPPPSTGICVGAGSRGEFDVSPRSCGFGPGGSGAEDAGIVPPPKGQSMNGQLWYERAR